MTEWIDAFVAMTAELAPWLLLGLLATMLLKLFVSPVLMSRWLGRGRWASAGRASLLGVPLPLCSCAVIPTGIGLHRQGASRHAAMSFLISTPQTGVDSTLVAAGLLGWPLALWKVAVALFTGIIGGALMPGSSPGVAGAPGTTPAPSAPRMGWRDAFFFTIDDVMGSIWRWLLLGLVVSASLQAWVPAETWPQPSSAAGVFVSLLIALIISLPLYVCATASVPIVAGLVAAGMPLGASLVVLFAGPATNIATIGAVKNEFGGRAAVWYVAIIVTSSLLGGAVFEFFLVPWLSSFGLAAFAVAGSASCPHDHQHGLQWFHWLSIALFGLMILRLVWRDLRHRFGGGSNAKAISSTAATGCCFGKSASLVNSEAAQKPCCGGGQTDPVDTVQPKKGCCGSS